MRSGGEQFLEAQPHLIHRLPLERFIPAAQIEDAQRDGPRLGHRNDIAQGLDRHALIPHFPGTWKSYEAIAFRSQDAQCPCKVFFFDQNIVCIVRGYRKDADLMFGKNPG